MNSVILYWVLVAVMIVGVIGALVPAIPGIGLILGAMLVWGFVSKFAGMGVTLVVTVVILLLSIAVDFLATVWGAKKVGASDWSQIGAMVGLFAGLFGFLPALPFGGPIIGLFLGPVVGAFVGEYAYRKEWETRKRFQQSLKVCVGIVVGTLFGNIAKALLALTSVIIFVYYTLPYVPK
ncbi:MAG: hypothetical protein N5P05_000160 [Chroococcopsis gigantea SAG 12.99]|jgi:uncharacterized protein YqgC (DUF456 family)|nr:DUF456 family protein [Chlorogloea purpurea SAG 13.99]MDV2998554.1 hypothetical protein [Chroococcopsis gigantea SAG 12.99]